MAFIHANEDSRKLVKEWLYIRMGSHAPVTATGHTHSGSTSKLGINLLATADPGNPETRLLEVLQTLTAARHSHCGAVRLYSNWTHCLRREGGKHSIADKPGLLFATSAWHGIISYRAGISSLGLDKARRIPDVTRRVSYRLCIQSQLALQF